MSDLDRIRDLRAGLRAVRRAALDGSPSPATLAAVVRLAEAALDDDDDAGSPALPGFTAPAARCVWCSARGAHVDGCLMGGAA